MTRLQGNPLGAPFSSQEDVVRLVNRALRWTAKNPGRKPPGHIHKGLLLLHAMKRQGGG